MTRRHALRPRRTHAPTYPVLSKAVCAISVAAALATVIPASASADPPPNTIPERQRLAGRPATPLPDPEPIETVYLEAYLNDGSYVGFQVRLVATAGQAPGLLQRFFSQVSTAVQAHVQDTHCHTLPVDELAGLIRSTLAQYAGGTEFVGAVTVTLQFCEVYGMEEGEVATPEYF